MLFILKKQEKRIPPTHHHLKFTTVQSKQSKENHNKITSDINKFKKIFLPHRIF